LLKIIPLKAINCQGNALVYFRKYLVLATSAKKRNALFLHVFEQFSSKLRYYKQYDIFDFISQLRTVENSEKAPLTVAKLEKLGYTP